LETAIDLISISEKLLLEAEKIQDETFPMEERQKQLKLVDNMYHEWYREALVLFNTYNQPQQREKFEKEYEGSWLSSKIKKFITSGLKPNILYKSEQEIPGLSKFTYPFSTSFKEPLSSQCNILSTIEISTNPVNNIQTADWNSTICRILHLFIDIAEKAQTNHEKKLTYEYLAMFLIGAIEGLSVIGHDERGTTSEVDVWVANHSQDLFLQKHLGDPFIIECKNWSEPVGVSQIRNLKAIMDNKNLKCSIIISKKGVTGSKNYDAVGEIQNAFRDGKYIVVLSQPDLLEIANGLHPIEKIKRQIYNLFKKSS